MSKELEQLRQIRHDFYINGEVDYDTISYFTNIERALKAFGVVRKSGYISIDKMLSQNYITRKEYDLLKEVLK